MHNIIDSNHHHQDAIQDRNTVELLHSKLKLTSLGLSKGFYQIEEVQVLSTAALYNAKRIQ